MVKFHSQTTGSRREFLRAAGRYPLLALLLATGGVLVSRQREAGAQCTRDFVCRDCSLLAGCPLPPAMTQKTSTSR